MKLSRLVVVAPVLVAGMLLSAPAHAQLTPGIQLGAEKELTEEEKARNRAREDAAKAAAARIPAQKASNDPWAGVRDVTPPPAAPTQINPKQKKK